MLVQDSYPERLLQEWDSWKNNHDSENERPSGCTPSANNLHLSQFFKLKYFTSRSIALQAFPMYSLVFLYMRYTILFIVRRVNH